ncbi:MAG: tRNA (N6-threonylcarbamoyladenosine(37)-N6)-methyltransferase TrmO [Lachnospiraceae bacterium]|nr:tRNA (N6-threonylcarbamoyladenosine(37)-N6)-methyltransferase TrmO [Lachnospiraceae bacterium]
MSRHEFEPIAEIRTDFPEKFGIPRQSGLVKEAMGRIVFFPKYRQPEAFRGLEGFSHLWLLWDFHEAKREEWSATVRPPRLGGKKRVGVFATRSPFRPNPIGLSVVRLLEIREEEKDGIVLLVSGVDMLDGTPIYDIKPYLPYADSVEDATDGFAGDVKERNLLVEFEKDVLFTGVMEGCSDEKREALKRDVSQILKEDPRTRFIQDEERIWGVAYGAYNVRFTVHGDVARIIKIETYERQKS